MSGKAGLIVGARGTGKTTISKKMLSQVAPGARLIYDVNAEYMDLYPRPFMEFDEFTSIINRARGAFILIEESTIFLNNRGNNFDIRSALVKARHRNNTFVFVFHSLRSIPRYIFDLCDFLVLLKTGDDLESIAGKFDNDAVTQAFIDLQAAPWIEGKGRRYSPHRVIQLMQ